MISIDLTGIDLASIDPTGQLLALFLTYGSPVIALVLMAAAVGLPVPSTLLVIATGAFVRQGLIDPYPAFVYALAGVLAGDLLSYAIGRFGRERLLGRYGTSERWMQVQGKLERSAGISIYLTRCLLTPLAIPTDLLAGAGGYPLRKFLAFDIAGELTWLLMLGGLGYAFSASSALIVEFGGAYGGPLVALVAGAAICWWLRRWTARNHSCWR